MKIFRSFMNRLMSGTINLEEHGPSKDEVSKAIKTKLEIELTPPTNREGCAGVIVKVMTMDNIEIGYYKQPNLDYGDIVTLEGARFIDTLTISQQPTKRNREMDLIKSPVKYEPMGTMIMDADNNHVLDVRGWGRFQYMKDGAAIQDSVGYFIAEAINEKNTREDASCSHCSSYKKLSGYPFCPECGSPLT